MQPYSITINADTDGVFNAVVFHACKQYVDDITDQKTKGPPIQVPVPAGPAQRFIDLANQLADKAKTAQLVQAERARRQAAAQPAPEPEQ